MTIETPKIDPRRAEQIYDQALRLARAYCHEWGNVLKEPPDEKDIGIVLLKLFSKLTETVIRQLNRIPEKHLLAFYDLVGIDLLPPAAARAPLTFSLSEGSKGGVSVPERTQVTSSEDPTVVFETTEPLAAVNLKIKSAYSLNPWADKYANHSSVVAGLEKGFCIFGGAEDEKPVEHILYIADEALDFKTPSDSTVTINFSFTNTNYLEKFKNYFSKCADGADNPLLPVISENKTSISFQNKLIKKTVIDGVERVKSFFPCKKIVFNKV
jgi:hypothetical protein